TVRGFESLSLRHICLLRHHEASSYHKGIKAFQWPIRASSWLHLVRRRLAAIFFETGLALRWRTCYNHFCCHKKGPVGQGVKTPPFHGGNRGSNPLRVTKFEPLAQSVEHLTFNQGVEGSSPSWLTLTSFFL